MAKIKYTGCRQLAMEEGIGHRHGRWRNNGSQETVSLAIGESMQVGVTAWQRL